MSCFPEAQDWLSFSLRPVNHPEESLTAAGDGPQCPAAFHLAGRREVLLTMPGVWLAAAGRVLRGLAWDSAAWQRELGPREVSSFAGRAPGSSSARSRGDGQVKAPGEEEEAGGSAFPLCQAAALLSLVSDLTETRVILSPSIPHGTELLITVVFFLIAPWSYALIYFFRENLGKKMVVSQANSSLPRAADYGQGWELVRQKERGAQQGPLTSFPVVVPALR